MAGYLYVYIIFEQPVAKEEDAYHQDAMRFVHLQGIPEDICIGGLQFPFQECPYRIINGVPEAQEEIGPLPNPWYIVNKIQSAKFAVKLSNEKEKASNRMFSR